MSDKKKINKQQPQKPYKPQAIPAKQVVAPCQKGIRIYPARLTLTNNAFEKIKTQGTVPVLPKSVPVYGEDYDLRRLRDGWVYILAVNAQSDCFSITGEAKNGQAWYIYRYHSENNLQGFSQWSTETFKEFIEEQTAKEQQDDVEGNQRRPVKATLNKAQEVGKQKLLTDYIELNQAISTIHIMYSDFELPYSLLEEIETSEKTRSLWMRKINIQEPTGAATNLQKLTDVVADFSPQDLDLENQMTNCHRYTPIGRLKNWQEVAERITYGKGVIVALEDPIGSIRDLACYHRYLDELREKTLSKYEYAIRTASFIHSHAQEKILYNFSQQKVTHKAVKDVIENKNPWYVGFAKDWERLYKKPLTAPLPKPITLAQSYKLYTKVNAIHLDKNSHSDIFDVLKNELNLEDIPGENAIHKMANLPGLYGKPFKSVAEAHIKLIAANFNRIEVLTSLLNNKESSAVYVANAFCLYAHGMLWGLDISSYGFNATAAALGKEMNVEYTQNTFQVSNETIQLLQNFVKLLNKSVEMLVTLAKSRAFSISSYDLVADVLITKHSALANPKNVAKVGKGSHFVHWKRVYEVNPVTGRYSHTDHFAAAPNSMKGEILNAVKITHNPPSEYAHFHVGGGLVKLQMLEVVFGFFNEQKYRTAEGQLANDPFLAAALALGGVKSTPILDKFKAKVDESKTTVRAALTSSGGKTHQQSMKLIHFKIHSLSQTSVLRQIAGRLISVNSALVFFNTLVEYGSWYEARYKNDVMGQYGAMLRGFGGVTAGASYGILGLLAENALIATGVTVALWVGLAAVVLGTIMGLMSKEDMDSWMENGFWGKSTNYWGNPIGGYEWKIERKKSFRAQFDESLFQYVENNNGISISQQSPKAFQYYEIELQRYFSFKQNIVLSKYENAPHAVLVEHPSLTNDAMAQSIRLGSQVTVMTNYAQYLSTQQPQRIEFIENGKAVLYFPTPWEGISWEIMNSHREKAKKEIIDERSVKRIRLKVSLSDYQGSEGKISSDLTTIPMK
ncbi:toxin VasX [Rodentibacter pneumotropicus]|uniref:toxin VasX n=1 Tax=Rodentibacter pneumotropicus TaxID=758 RepID=UPI001EE39284|nr:toxin VasX [Rodentibacter pneumotropicus]